MGITFGDHLIDIGYNDITPEQEREIEAREECARRGIDPDANCADGGIDAWMIVARELAGTALSAALVSPVGQIAGGIEIKVKPMRLSDDRCDYFVSFQCGEREVTPHVFRERFKAEYHVALYRWLFGQEANEPNAIEFNAGDWPALSAAPAPPATGWQAHYDRPEHLALDLRQIADNADHRVGFATMDAQILRRAAACFDRLPEDASLREAREAVRLLPSAPGAES
ncbi:hypothetical protein LB517_27925 [Mesorhizobium sp. BR1-1-12]|uniref:hypothetical protein n=1 Tax=Mesorhizobium sp. BR1-1-12 TaxID=2876657 RepID=UPI001CD16367|nr:hypothetical protein [Mesorhizobium sp. BR1-1-12]MBZ9973462.1 hypothetical protein [Mesorhizobium sp. BR1-1-12]